MALKIIIPNRKNKKGFAKKTDELYVCEIVLLDITEIKRFNYKMVFSIGLN